jgi:hypothetical protein
MHAACAWYALRAAGGFRPHTAACPVRPAAETWGCDVTTAGNVFNIMNNLSWIITLAVGLPFVCCVGCLVCWVRIKSALAGRRGGLQMNRV